jgi:ribosomal-protein-alanine N-acetyltransferase
MIVETERLILRHYVEDDAEAFHELNRDPEVLRYLDDGGTTSVEHARQILRDFPLADYAKYGFGRWACVLKETGKVIGFAGLKYLPDRREVDVGYRFMAAYWGRGLATEANRPAIDHGFARLGLDHIIGMVRPANVASVRVLEKLGLRYAGMLDDRGSPCARYVITRADWRPAGDNPR